MDLMTIMGFGIGLGAVYIVMLHGGVVNLLFNLDAAILVFGGTLGSTFIAFPFRSIKQIPSALKLIFFPPPKIDFEILTEELVNIAGMVRKGGVFSLREYNSKTKNGFFEKYLEKVANGIEKEIILDGMKQEIFAIAQRHERVSGIFQAMATFSPIFGLLGTLIGVVQVLRNLTDPQSMGASMAIAVTTTFYGIFGANFLFLPASLRLDEYSSEEILAKELIAEGIESILNNEVPSVTAHRLEVFLSQKVKEKKKK